MKSTRQRYTICMMDSASTLRALIGGEEELLTNLLFNDIYLLVLFIKS